jgi:predicted  nucleic acid-binding Zn-ribbon protein
VSQEDNRNVHQVYLPHWLPLPPSTDDFKKSESELEEALVKTHDLVTTIKDQTKEIHDAVNQNENKVNQLLNKLEEDFDRLKDKESDMDEGITKLTKDLDQILGQLPKVTGPSCERSLSGNNK